MSKCLTMVLVVVFAGCTSHDGVEPSTPEAPLALPADLDIPGAELVERNDTFARFLWMGTASPGSEAVDPPLPVILAVPMPAHLPLVFLAGLRFEANLQALGVEVQDGAGHTRCEQDYKDEAGGDRLACAAAVEPLEGGESWRVLVHSRAVPPPGLDFELELRYRVDGRVFLLDSVTPEEPACHARRAAVRHVPGGPAKESSTTACFLDVGRLTWEPSLGILPDGTVVVAPVYTALRASVASTEHALLRSRDDGSSWQEIQARAAGVNQHQGSSDPYLHVDATTGRIFYDNLLPMQRCSLLSFSDDGGDTWQHSVNGCLESDHQNVFTGPPAISTTLGYPNVVYRCAISGGLYTSGTATTCSKSLDGGLTWVQTGAPAFGPQAAGTGVSACVDKLTPSAPGHGFVGSSGRVFVPQGYCGQPWLAISDDEGATWRTTQVSELGMPLGSGTLFGIDGDAHEHESSVGVGKDVIQYGWIAANRLPYVTYSIDGVAWTDPLPVAPPNVLEATLGAMAVSPDFTAFAYLGSTNSPGAPWTGDYSHTTWNAYLTIIHNITGESQLTTSIINNPIDPITRGTCGPTRCSGLYDFIDVQISGDGTAWAVYADVCDRGCALESDAGLVPARMFMGKFEAGS